VVLYSRFQTVVRSHSRVRFLPIVFAMQTLMSRLYSGGKPMARSSLRIIKRSPTSAVSLSRQLRRTQIYHARIQMGQGDSLFASRATTRLTNRISIRRLDRVKIFRESNSRSRHHPRAVQILPPIPI